MRGTPRLHRDDASAPAQPVRHQGARELVPEQLRPLHDAVTMRARESGATALLLTGSTARGTRTAISDLDYHLVGEPIATDDLAGELDLHVVSPTLLNARLREGDDFTQWSLRFGCVVFDEGIVRESVQLVAEQRLWPDPARKEQQARKSLGIARAMVASGDHDAAVEQVRTALSLTARWRLLADGRFPLARAELPAQLNDLGYTSLAIDLDATIHDAPPLHQLGPSVEAAYNLLDPPPTRVERDAPSRAA
jgi:hypothetical protein